VRVGLAAAVFSAPDVLLLDEPTNHLSIEGLPTRTLQYP
jgi:ATPase subunit of ABC transporter with duplicated ATPase domains